jgi:hypothetical protein
MKLTIKHKQTVILALLLVLLLITLVQGCGNTKGTDCTAPAGSTIEVTGPGVYNGLSADTCANYVAVVKYPDGSPMPKACLTVSGSFAFPRNATQTNPRYQFYFYPNCDVNLTNAPVNSGYSAQADDFGTYAFSALITAPSGTFTDTITVQSGGNVGTVAIGIQ